MPPTPSVQTRISLARRRVGAKLVDAALMTVVGVALWLISLDEWVILGPLGSRWFTSSPPALPVRTA